MKILRPTGDWFLDTNGSMKPKWGVFSEPEVGERLETVFYYSGMWVYGRNPLGTDLQTGELCWEWLANATDVSDFVLVAYDWKLQPWATGDKETSGQGAKILPAKDLDEAQKALAEQCPQLQFLRVEIISRCNLPKLPKEEVRSKMVQICEVTD